MCWWCLQTGVFVEGAVRAVSEPRQKETLIRRESDAALKTKLAWLTVKSGMVMTNAGIDESNADGKLLLLPRDLYACAAQIRRALCQAYGLKNWASLLPTA